MNPAIDQLKAYPFARLAKLLQNETLPSAGEMIDLSIGEPKHAPPAVVMEALAANLDRVSTYPPTAGYPELRKAIADWACRRFGLGQDSLDHLTQVLPVNGTREALFAITQLIADPGKTGGQIGMPNPFYQIYEGAALLAGKQPVYFNTGDRGQPEWKDISDDQWQKLELLYICTPGNPSGVALKESELAYLARKAREHDFVLVSDECYSELWLDEPPAGVLQACWNNDMRDFRNVVACHSLSKRSNLPGLRTGFVAGDAQLMCKFALYRTYHGSAMPGMTQLASIAAWNDETHAEVNRSFYREKYDAVLPLLAPHFELTRPDAGFYLWLKTPLDDQEYCRRLYAEAGVQTLPGSYLTRRSDGIDPGQKRLRMALVAPVEHCVQGIERLLTFHQQL